MSEPRAEPRLRISFGDPEAGGITMVLTHEDFRFHQHFSYTPSDSFSELLTAIGCCLGGDGTHAAEWNVNPARYVFEFHRTGYEVELRVAHWRDQTRSRAGRTPVFTVRGTFDEICMPFWRGVRELQSRFTHEELTRRWHRAFPSDQAERLREKLAMRAR